MTELLKLRSLTAFMREPQMNYILPILDAVPVFGAVEAPLGSAIADL